MKKAAALILPLLLCFAQSAASAPQDAKGCKEHPLFPNRLPNYYIAVCESKDFEAYDFYTVKPPKKTVEGRFTYIQYQVVDPKKEASAVEVVRNYENALKKIGGTIQGTVPNWWVNGTVMVDGKRVWAQAEKGNGRIWIRIVEEQAMAQTIVADANTLKDGLKATGHVTVEGIYFDTGKTDIKPESAQAIGEIAKMLKADPGLKIYVVGHTDTVGSVESNLKLSEGRAGAVTQSLVKEHGIQAARLRAFGAGPFAPVASNDAEDGRARNRRVELVKQ